MRAFSHLLALTAAAVCCAVASASPIVCDRVSTPFATPSMPPPAVGSTTAAPRSALATFPGQDVRQGVVASGSARATMLVSIRAAQVHPLATVSDRVGLDPRRIELHPAAAPGSVSAAQDRLGALEQLYAFLMRQDPLDRFVMVNGPVRAAPGDGVSHSKALQLVAAMRTCAVQGVRKDHPELRIKPWRIALVTLRPPRGHRGLDVSAVVRDDAGKPLGGHLSFARGDHLVCSATLSNGSGTCTLFDAHGHELSDHDHRGSTLVSYGGVVTEDLIILPTTLLHRPRR